MDETNDARLEHVEYQRRYFDQNCDFFRQPIPEEIEERTQRIVHAAQLNAASKVLDVGTGMGVLIRHIKEAGVPEKNIVGCDLSTNMLEEASKRYPEANFWQGDIVDLPVPEVNTRGYFDAVFFNACFGNIYDQPRAIEVVASVLKPSGRIVISHPLGNQFVQKLKEMDQQLVLTLLPDEPTLQKYAAPQGLVIEYFKDELEFYLAVLQKP